MKQIENLLRQAIGWNPTAFGADAFEHSVRARMAALGISQTDGYRKQLLASREEWDALVEMLIVPETWFFRDAEAFRSLADIIQRKWLPSHPKGRLRILSLPCSTGEEPYSIAMSLLDAGIPSSRFQIDAFDLRSGAIATALRAEYGKNSFRGKDLGFRSRYFKPTSKSFVLDPSIRKLVRFNAANLLDDGCFSKIARYDFIFCRNLLIYFDRPTQARALQKLDCLLTHDGVLFVGSAEVGIAEHNGFVSAHLPFSFACRKLAAHDTGAKQSPRPVFVSPEQHADWLPAPSRAFPFQNPALAVPDARTADLQRARQLADQGRLAEAATLCETSLRTHGACAEAYYLLGLVRDAAGASAEADELYRKALYLEPNHYETLMHWASLSKKSGDRAHARLLSKRAERVKRPETS